MTRTCPEPYNPPIMCRGNKPIRILRIISRLNIGGPARHVVILSSRLNTGAFETLLVSGMVKEYEGDMSYLAGEYGVAARVIRSLGREITPLDDLRSFITLLGIMRSFRPDIVHTHASKAGALGRAAAAVAGVPVIVHTFHGHVFRGYFSGGLTSLVIALERFLTRLTAAIVTLSPSQKQEITRRYRVAPGSKVHIVPLGLDLADYMESERASGTLRRSLGLEDGLPIVATVGRLVPIKDHVTFLEAARKVLEEQPAVRFVIVGDGETRPGLEKLSEDLGISDAVSFTGWVRDLGGVYQDIDVLAQSSINEGTPVSVIEAMAGGCCVVATRAGGTVDVVRDGENGLTVAVGDPDALASAILRVLRDPQLRTELGEGARASAKRYDSARLAADMERLYLDLLAGRQKKVKL